MSLPSTLRFVTSHPLSRKNPLAAVGRFASWQIRSRLSGDVTVPWIDGARLVARRGMTGATGNIYCGLHEFTEMAFLLHLLQPDDLFLDIGANVGSYTILAARVCGARVVAFEPDPGTTASLRKNVAANGVEEQVRIEVCALGDRNGEIAFTIGLDTVNRIAEGSDDPSRTVAVRRLDDACEGENPVLIKMDVEGFEGAVLSGAGKVLARKSLMAIQSELGDSQVTRVLGDAGFQPHYYNPFTRTLGREPMEGKSLNTLFVREDARLAERLAAAPRRTVHGVTF